MFIVGQVDNFIIHLLSPFFVLIFFIKGFRELSLTSEFVRTDSVLVETNGRNKHFVATNSVLAKTYDTALKESWQADLNIQIHCSLRQMPRKNRGFVLPFGEY